MNDFRTDKEFALRLDKNDPLAHFREQFYIPKQEDGSEVIYFCGNSLGLQPKSTRSYLEQEMLDWETLAVAGHFRAKNPWLPYHEYLTEQTAGIVGARPIEVVVMNTLTVNLHLMLVSFYRPTANRYKILMEANAFPSDRYAVKSQIRFHNYDPERALLKLPLRPGESTHYTEDIVDFIEKEGDEIALILLGGINYYSGQAFEMDKITRAGHKMGCVVGFDCAHAAGNLALHLHDWDVDFAVWCTYKYLNAGPGAIAGCFVHKRFSQADDLPRFSGWWGHDKETRFLMGPDFKAIPGAEGWQLSNPPILSMAALRASLDIFDKAGFQNMVEKSKKLTSYIEFLLGELSSDYFRIITPKDPQQRGCQLSIQMKTHGKEVHDMLTKSGVICDWRQPDVIRIAPVPLYNTYTDGFNFVNLFKNALANSV